MDNAECIEKATLFDRMVESLPIPIFIIDAHDYTVEITNQPLDKDQPDLPKCYALARGFSEGCEESHQNCPLEEVKRTKKRAKVEQTRIDPLGGERLVEVHAFPILDDDGNVSRVLEYHFDVTRHRQALEEMQLFRSLVDQSNDAFFVIDPETSRFLDVDEKACSSLGYTRDELLNMHVMDIEAALPGPEMWQQHVQEIRKCNHLVMEGEHKRKDGTVFPVEVSIRYAKVQSGEYFIAVSRDITERKKADEALQSQIDFIQRLINTIPTPIYYKDASGVYMGCNKAFEELMGLSGDEIVGKPSFEVASSDVDDEHHDTDLELIRAGGNQLYESPVMFADGSMHNIAFNKATYADEDGEVAGLVGVMLDTTEQKRAEEALQESNRRLEAANKRLQQNQSQLIQSEKMAAIGQLAAGVAHEINNPVGYVKSNLGTLSEYVATLKELVEQYKRLETALDDGDESGRGTIRKEIEKINTEEDLSFMMEDVDHLLEESMEGTERVREIVQGLKSFARVDEAQVKEADINELIETTLKIVWNELKYNCTVHKDLKPLPSLRCHPGQLNQVFMNLFVNAAQSIPGKGDITISTKATRQHIVIEVADTGVGIPAENLPRLFDPFFTTKQVGKGTGLGLSISHGIIHKHNGTIEVESEVGKGTTFTVRLPVEGVSDE